MSNSITADADVMFLHYASGQTITARLLSDWYSPDDAASSATSLISCAFTEDGQFSASLRDAARPFAGIEEVRAHCSGFARISIVLTVHGLDPAGVPISYEGRAVFEAADPAELEAKVAGFFRRPCSADMILSQPQNLH